MRLKALILFSLLALAWWTRVHAQSDDPKLVPLTLTDEQDEYPLGLYLDILEDPGGELTIDDVSSPEFDSRFEPSRVEVPNFGFTDSVYWTRLRLESQARSNVRWLLELEFANMQFVDLYTPLQSGEGYVVKQTGTQRPVSTRDIRYPEFVFELTLPTQSQQTYYLRFKNDASMTLALTLWSPDGFLVHNQQNLLKYGLFFGLLLGLFGYNLFLLISLREKSYLFLTLFIANMMFFEATYAGYLETLAFPGLYSLKPFYLPLSFALIFIWALLFAHSFLDVKTQAPRLHWVTIGILAVWGMLIILIPFISYLTLTRLMLPWGLMSLVVVIGTGIVSWRLGFQPARFFLVAWFGLVVTLIIVLLVRLGIVPSTPFTESSYHLGIMWMAVCWSIALADRINLLKAETEEANREIRNSELRLAQILEGLPLGVVVYGKDYRPSFANRRVAEILGNPDRGIEPDISAGRTLAEAMNYYSFRVANSDEDYPVKKLPVFRALQGEEASADDAEADLVDRRVPLEIWASPVMDDAGNVEAAVVAFQDITDRKQVELALRASERKFRVVVENNFDGVVFMARDRQVLYVSPSYQRLNGMSTRDMIGQSGVDFVHPDDRARIAEAFAELLQRPGGKVTIEYRSKHQDGSWFWVETNAVNLLDDPRVRAVVLNIRDISERKRSESELAAHREHLERIVEERTKELLSSNQRLSHEIIEREKLEQLLFQHLEWLTVLNEIRHSITGTADLQMAYDNLSATILELLNVRMVFILRWEKDGEPIEAVGYMQGDNSVHRLDGVASIFEYDSTLRNKFEMGQSIYLSPEQATSSLAPLETSFQEDDVQSLLLAPLFFRQSVNGVLGVTISKSMQDFARGYSELIETITLDLSELFGDAKLLDQAKALAATEERNRLARDLHDSVTQVLFSASLVAEVLPQIWRRDPERALRSIEELRRLTRGALAEMRTLLLELRPNSVFKTPLPELLAQLTEAITARIELPFRLFIEQTPPLPEEVHISFYRIAQEALNNVVKHAQASQVTVSLSATPKTSASTGSSGRELKLVIEDDGVGYSTGLARQEHLGFGIMRERASSIQATLSVNSLPGAGTQVSLIWPGKPEYES